MFTNTRMVVGQDAKQIDSMTSWVSGTCLYCTNVLLDTHAVMLKTALRLSKRYYPETVTLHYWVDDEKKIIKWDYYVRGKTTQRMKKDCRYVYHVSPSLWNK